VKLNPLIVEVNIILMKSVKHTTLLSKAFSLYLLGQLAWYKDHAEETDGRGNVMQWVKPKRNFYCL